MSDPVIKFFAPVNEATIQKLMVAVDTRVAAGAERLTPLISTSGGSVFYGLSAFNYLKGLPLHPVTMNFSAGAAFEEAQMPEKLKSMRVDMDNCAKVVAAHTNRTIRQELFVAGSEVVSIAP